MAERGAGKGRVRRWGLRLQRSFRVRLRKDTFVLVLL